MSFWEPVENGNTIGFIGSENGYIVMDEEHELGARITLERDGSFAPWAITCGIYGCFMHTAFAKSEDEGVQKYNSMKNDLVSIMNEESSDLHYEAMSHFANVY